MVVLDNSSEKNLLEEEPVPCAEETLREERRKTGRYLAAGIVIFLVVLGLYQAVYHGSSRLSALLGAALVMLFYLLWVLYASQRKKRLDKIKEQRLQQNLEEIVIHAMQSKEKPKKEKSRENVQEHSTEITDTSREGSKENVNSISSHMTVCRSYSIA